MHIKRSSNAFTLVEVLVSLVIVSMLAGMVLTAVQGVTRTAREARTKSIIAIVDSVVSEKYESLLYRPLPVEVPSIALNPSSDSELTYEVLATEAARVRLVMLRDLQRMVIPERFTDITGAPVSINAACNVVRVSGGDIVGTRNDLISRKTFPVQWSEPTELRTMRGRLSGLSPSTANQGAECLYLILSTTIIGGTPAIDSIPVSNIGDTDRDFVPEILDGWGRPLAFIRWPVGYSDPERLIDKTSPDDFDPFRVDFAYAPGVVTSPSSSAVPMPVDIQSGSISLKPWSLKPMVASAGDDGEFGIALNPFDASGIELDAYSYTAATWNWSTNSDNMGLEHQGRTTATYTFPDPFFRQFLRTNDVDILDRSAGPTNYTTRRRLPGEDLTNDPDLRRVDNISNFDLMVSE